MAKSHRQQRPAASSHRSKGHQNRSSHRVIVLDPPLFTQCHEIPLLCKKHFLPFLYALRKGHPTPFFLKVKNTCASSACGRGSMAATSTAPPPCRAPCMLTIDTRTPPPRLPRRRRPFLDEPPRERAEEDRRGRRHAQPLGVGDTVQRAGGGHGADVTGHAPQDGTHRSRFPYTGLV